MLNKRIRDKQAKEIQQVIDKIDYLTEKLEKLCKKYNYTGSITWKV